VPGIDQFEPSGHPRDRLGLFRVVPGQISGRLKSAGQRNEEGGTGAVVRRCPQPPVVTFDDRTADGKPDSHSVALGREERLEEPFDLVDSETDARVLHDQPRAIVIVARGSKDQLPPTILDRAHRLAGVEPGGSG